jgi:hypothetical protein
MTADTPHEFKTEDAARAALLVWVRENSKPGAPAGGYVCPSASSIGSESGKPDTYTVHVRKGATSWALRLWEVSPANPEKR